MKKLIFGCTLLFSGVFGFVGIIIATACRMIERSGGGILDYLGNIEIVAIIIFVLMAISGLLTALFSLSDDKKI